MAFKKEHSLRTKHILELLNIPDVNIVKNTGLSKSVISHIMTEAQDVSLDALAKIIKAYPNINANYILTGTGLMFIESIELNEGQDIQYLYEENRDKVIELQRELEDAWTEIGKLKMELNKKTKRS